MIKTILVPTSGYDTDESVFATALGVARPLGAHLNFYHLRLSACEAAVRSPHIQYCAGSTISDALHTLGQRDEQLSARALKHFEEFCAHHRIEVSSAPTDGPKVSAQFSEETDHADSRFPFHARHSDLVVLGRRKNVDLMPYDLIELLLVGSGRPIIVAPERSPANVTDTIVVGWKETPEAARSLGAAMPLLKLAHRVILVSIAEDGDSLPDSLDQLARQLLWHGIRTESRVLAAKSEPAPVQLRGAARDAGAGLLVIGGYGHTSLRESVFGGVTRALIEHAECPVFLMH